MNHALIDGDIIVYRAALACEEYYYLVNKRGSDDQGREFKYKAEANNWIHEQANPEDYEINGYQRITKPIEASVQYAKELIERILWTVKAKDYNIYLSGGGKTFRHKLYSGYKTNRSRTPIYKKDITQYLVNNWLAEKVPSDYEADDLLGVQQCTNDGTIICSIDKDLQMIPGRHYNFISGIKNIITNEQAKYNFLKQMLTGDRVDNIKGIDGIGEKKAENILRDDLNLLDTLPTYYKKNRLTEEDLYMTAKLIWICRSFKDIELTSYEDIVDKYFGGVTFDED